MYIGSTTQSLRQRMNEHKRKNSKCSSIKMGDLKKCKIVLIEDFKCENRKELLSKEREYFKRYKKKGFEIVNKNTPFTTKLEKNIKSKEWYKNNKEKCNKRAKEWIENNIERHKKYLIDTKEKRKEWRILNKEILKEKRKEKRKEKIQCECGSLVIYSDRSNHYKSIKHITYILENDLYF